MEPGKKAVFLIEPLPAGETDISPLSQMEVSALTAAVKILDLLLSVVMDPVGFAAAARTFVLLTAQFQFNMPSFPILINIFYDYPCGSEQRLL